MTRDVVCAVDVGTRSARAGFFDGAGRLLARAQHPIAINQPRANHAEHDSEDIWNAVCTAVKTARNDAGLAADAVAAMAFDATCSLVVRGDDGDQVSVSTTGETRWDTIVWLDHRALAEADECTATGHRVLAFCGGAMSPEMQTPKLMWLKRHLPATWGAARAFRDLADFLSWKACGTDRRSQATLASKWAYLPKEGGWQRDFLDAVGLGDLVERAGHSQEPALPGTALGPLTAEAAAALSLDTGCIVAAGVIDAFAGALGVIGGQPPETIERHQALVAGTSSCVMGFSRDPSEAAGVWGPYHGAALPDLWLSEAGQSATGALLDHVIRLYSREEDPGSAMHARIAERIETLLREEGPELGREINILPDFHGNRSPHSNAHAHGVASGLSLDTSFDGLCRLYWRTAVAIALGVRQILQHLEAHGARIETLHVTGGHTRNPVLMKLYADATGCTVSETQAEDAVLLGTAMIAATGAGWHQGMAQACRAMRQPSVTRAPDASLAGHYDRDYRVFLKMQDHRRELDDCRKGPR